MAAKLALEDILPTIRDMMGKENASLTANDLKEPTSAVILPVLTVMVENILAMPIPKQTPFAAAQMLDHPHLYEESVVRMRVLKCLQLCCKFSMVPFEVDMGDLVTPERKRTRVILNCLTNYLRHCVTNDQNLHEIERNLSVLHKESVAKGERLRRLQEQLNALEGERHAEEPEVFCLTEIATQLQVEMEQLNVQQSELRTQLLQLKEGSAAQQVKLEAKRVDSAQTKQAIEDLRARIVESPDRLKAQNAERGREVAELRSQVVAMGERRQKCLSHLAELQKLAAEVAVHQEQVAKLNEQKQGMAGMERHNSDLKSDMDDLRLHHKRLTLRMQSLKEEQEQEVERFTRQQQQLRMQCESMRQRIQQHQEQEQQIMADVEQQVCESNKYLEACQEVEADIADVEAKHQGDIAQIQEMFDLLVSRFEQVTREERQVFEAVVASSAVKPS